MADQRLTAITNEETVLAVDDWFYVVDKSDTTDHASGSSAKIQASNVANTLVPGATIGDTGSLITATTVDGAFQEIFNGSAAVNTNATTGATETLTLAPVHKMTMDQACTFTFPTPSAASHTFILHLIGAFTVTWPASVDWGSGTAPTYATPSIFVFTTDDTGTTWFGNMVGSGFA